MISFSSNCGPRRVPGALALTLLAAGSLLAQSSQTTAPGATRAPGSTSARTGKVDPPPKRFTIGGRFSLFYPKGVKGGSRVDNITAGPVELTTTTSGAAAMGGGGIGMEYFITRRLSLSLDIIGHKTGYNYHTQRLTGAAPASGATDIRDKLIVTQRVTATNWDVPLILRYNDPSMKRWRHRLYYGGGLAARMTAGTKTSTDYQSFVNGEAGGVGLTEEYPVGPQHRMVPGVVVCAGYRLKDEFSVKVTPELRYTRWFSPTYDRRPIVSRKDQFEFVLGIGF